MVSEAGLAVRVSLLAASLPLPMVFPWRWGHGVRLYLLGWFAILEVLVLKSRVPRFSWSLRFSRGALSSGLPVQWPPFRGGPSGSSVRYVEFACSTGHLASCVSLFARFRPACGLVFAALGVIHVSVFSGSPSAVRVLCPLLRRVDVARQDLPCSSVGGLHCPGPVNARQFAWENVFNLV